MSKGRRLKAKVSGDPTAVKTGEATIFIVCSPVARPCGHFGFTHKRLALLYQYLRTVHSTIQREYVEAFFRPSKPVTGLASDSNPCR